MEAPDNIKRLFDFAVNKLQEEILGDKTDVNRSSILLNTVIETYNIIKDYKED